MTPSRVRLQAARIGRELAQQIEQKQDQLGLDDEQMADLLRKLARSLTERAARRQAEQG